MGTTSRAGVDEDLRLYQSLDQFWHPVIRDADLTDSPELVVLLERRLVIARLNNEIVAFDDRCVHRGASMALGAIEDGCLRCAYHGWLYDNDGVIVEVPANPEISASINVGLPKLKCTVKHGLVWVSLSDDPVFPIPDFPHLGDPEFRVISCDPYDWNCASVRRLENYVDFGHFAWVHDGYLGSRDHPEIGEHETWREGGTLRAKATVMEPPSGKIKKHLIGPGELITATNEYWISLPHAVLLDRHFEGGARYVLFMVACPIGPNQTRSFWFIGRNYAMEPEADGEFVAFEWEILAQDEPVVESLLPKVIPSALGEEMYVKTADAVTLGYRQWLNELATAREAASS